MTENENENEQPTRNQTHAAIDNAIATHVNNIGLTGLLASWALVGSVVSITDDGDEMETLYQTSSQGVSRWQQIGLLSDALDNVKFSGAVREVELDDDEDGVDD
jgi:hypothetical protein